MGVGWGCVHSRLTAPWCIGIARRPFKAEESGSTPAGATQLRVQDALDLEEGPAGSLVEGLGVAVAVGESE